MEELAIEYQKKTDIQHILDTPDTYVGSIEEDEYTNWMLNENNKMIWGKFKNVPGEYKCFDEGIVNARDHFIRLKSKIKIGKATHPVTAINVSVDKETGIITIYNDGDGIDVVKHPTYDIWIPEMIFGHLRTSTNYKKDEKKIVGGKNGFGFKLVLIYSKWGMVETVDHNRGLKFKQEFKNNLSYIGKPIITKTKQKPYTKVSFLLDYERFEQPGLTNSMYNVLHKRTFDIAAVTDKSVKVKWNNKLVPVRTFEQYINCYIGNKTETKRIYQYNNERWEYAVCLSPLDEFTHVSFVNGINTCKGGKHVEYILNQIVKKLILYIEKKKKVKVKPATIKEQLMLFVNCVIENPTFDSQTKEYMNLKVSKFGSTCVVDNKFIDKVAKLGVMETALLTNIIKEKNAGKKTDGKKTSSIRNCPKLIDANWAGGKRSFECTLILCEGDSAKAGVVSGLSKEDRNKFGVFPLKGKLINTDSASIQKLNANAEINNIKKILGLEVSKQYKNTDDIKKYLRYGKVLFMTDQDLDGSHIKGLGINMFQSLWEDLIKIPGFLGYMNTPILKAKKGKKERSFYTLNAFEQWKKKNPVGWKIKYYKGLGTSTSKEFREYFKDKRVVHFDFSEDCKNAIDLVFNKKRSDDRKEWLGNYDKTDTLDTDKQKINYHEFIHREMKHFSKYDCERSIPNIMDGLKTSQRKILWSAFKRNLVKEIKVAQLSGYISEHSMYHHGETSLQKTIVGMAQEFMGSNNIALFQPNGQFGTRMLGGKDSASERYIYTLLSAVTRSIFRKEDDQILNYLEDDGTKIEPDFYMPIIPLSLVNGGEGIGTGFSTKILSYNPLDLIKYLLCLLKGKSPPTLKPYYENFNGEIKQIEKQKWLFRGNYAIIDKNTIQITELPIGVWTQDYKEHLEKLMDGGKKKKPIVKQYTDMSTDTQVNFTIHMMPGMIDKLLSKGTFEKKLKLITTRMTSNQYLFDHNQCIKKYKSVDDIINGYFPVRLEAYKKRKEAMIQTLEYSVKILSNKARFIQEQCEDTIDLRRKKKQQVIDLLDSRNYDKIKDNYEYLTKMPICSLQEENITILNNEAEQQKIILCKLKETTIKEMWISELKECKKSIEKYKKMRLIRKGTD
ncbi:toprim domain-containing protein [bacterium]|nr:toprim domain-containing protein [bacterium]